VPLFFSLLNTPLLSDECFYFPFFCFLFSFEVQTNGLRHNPKNWPLFCFCHPSYVLALRGLESDWHPRDLSNFPFFPGKPYLRVSLTPSDFSFAPPSFAFLLFFPNPPPPVSCCVFIFCAPFGLECSSRPPVHPSGHLLVAIFWFWKKKVFVRCFFFFLNPPFVPPLFSERIFSLFVSPFSFPTASPGLTYTFPFFFCLCGGTIFFFFLDL